MKNKVIVIVGPTASGKSSLALDTAEALHGKIISADSMQIYKGLDIGTAKATKEEMQRIPHDMIDICEITEKFDVATYKKMCYDAIDKAILDGFVPIIVGGTGLYINAVVNNVTFAETIDENKEVEQKIAALKSKTTEELYEYLCEINTKKAESVDRFNRRRVERAIYLTLLGNTTQDNNLWVKSESKYDFIVFYIDMPRDLLYDRINKRVDVMTEQGVTSEAKILYDLQDKKNNTACQAIGYKEFFPYLDNTKSLEECVETLKINTRHYAKRQITWFKKLPDKIIMDGTRPRAELVKQIVKEYYESKT